MFNLSPRTNVFKITAGNLGPLQKIVIRNDDSGDSSDWHLEKIVVNDTTGSSYKFPANVWLSHDPGNQLEMSFELSKCMNIVDQDRNGQKQTSKQTKQTIKRGNRLTN